MNGVKVLTSKNIGFIKDIFSISAYPNFAHLSVFPKILFTDFQDSQHGFWLKEGTTCNVNPMKIKTISNLLEHL